MILLILSFSGEIAATLLKWPLRPPESVVEHRERIEDQHDVA
jgi:hypothetical protein